MMRVLITGSNGLVGNALVSSLENAGHKVGRLMRSAPIEVESEHAKENENIILWDPEHGIIDKSLLEGYDAVVHLAGENIAEGRWDEAKKRRILESRVQGTELLSQTLAGLASPPKVLVCASAMGYFGEQGSQIVTENSPNGSGFLAKVCCEWESATKAAEQRGIRVVKLRLGMVLTSRGGALARMLLPFKLGLGGILGDGHQYVSWVTLDDLIKIIPYCIENSSIVGPVNVGTPDPVTNLTFTKTLGTLLHRPTVFSVPSWLARLAFGEMAEELLLQSIRMKPEKLLESGYRFQYPHLPEALEHVLRDRA